MELLIDFSPFYDFFNLPPDQLAVELFWLVGWIPLSFILLWGILQLWLDYIATKWAMTRKYIYLAIDIPQTNEQSPRAVENLFAYFGGAHGTQNLFEKYWEGVFQQSFSFEIVGIDGYTQFVIRAPDHFRNLVESAVYSQYPDAEITEIEDYAKKVPAKYPDSEYDVFGFEWFLSEPDVYPIKTYMEFEHQLGDSSTYFRDPMASLLDMYSSLRKGEQAWFQIIVTPIDVNWVSDAGDKEIGKILGEKIVAPPNFFTKIADGLLGSFYWLAAQLHGLWGEVPQSDTQDDGGPDMMNLRPKQKKQIEAIQMKVSKLAFMTKIRFVYVAKKEIMNKAKVASGFVGFIKQFGVNDLNSYRPEMNTTATKAAYFFVDKRIIQKQNRIMENYIGRAGSSGARMNVLNVEELATLWHFPIEASVKAPLIQKTAGRKAEPPMSLPIGEEVVSEEIMPPIFTEENDELKTPFQKEAEDEKITNKDKGKPAKKVSTIDKTGSPPGNLPFA